MWTDLYSRSNFEHAVCPIYLSLACMCQNGTTGSHGNLRKYWGISLSSRVSFEALLIPNTGKQLGMILMINWAVNAFFVLQKQKTSIMIISESLSYRVLRYRKCLRPISDLQDSPFHQKCPSLCLVDPPHRCLKNDLRKIEHSKNQTFMDIDKRIVMDPRVCVRMFPMVWRRPSEVGYEAWGERFHVDFTRFHSDFTWM